MSPTFEHIEKRYSYDKKGKQIDNFYRAWILANARSNNDRSGSPKSGMIKEYTQYADELCLTDYQTASAVEKEKLEQEWHSFANEFLSSCKYSRDYGTAMFGILRLSDDKIKQKIEEEYTRVTKEYPAILGLEELFWPLYQIMKEEAEKVL